ncbi:hypothetical protein BBK14_11280 [Parafrankia soli]|uniref:Phage head morphogenesis domain-containing protein n=1 Tax=Parafrankia soli TaxID=2599596 RepID=A0A1S1R8F4_9ACTN|nr:hypothetical protein [Parafrankia soli]OHV42196.1 hypothetical protein BBK14_11280 [Parafrankia soli]
MALTAEGNQLTADYRHQQLALRASTLLDLGTLWGLFDVSTPGSYDAFVTAATSLIRERHGDSSALAGAYLRTFRQAEGIRGSIPAFRAAERPVPGQIAIALRATGLAGTVRALRAGQTMRQALATGLVEASGATSRLVLDGGRRTVEAYVEADPLAKGWVRVGSASPCAFCAMLISRGPVYRSERSARFEAHDHCGCTAAPYYGGAESAQTRKYQALWRETAAGKDDQLNRFRRALAEQAGHAAAAATE